LESGAVRSERAGHVYTIDLPDPAIARMLDYDAPIKNQPHALDAIRKLIDDQEILRSFNSNAESGIAGANAFRNYVPGKTEVERAQALRAAGIPGIRYLDQGSRGAGQGTSNFVVFPGEEDLLRILSVEGGLLAP
jgi:hypothetical protein